MKLSAIAQLLSGSLNPSQFTAECAPDLAERHALVGRDGQAPRGSVIPVRVIDDGPIAVSREGINNLLRHFVRGDLSAIDLAYIADALQLAENVQWENDDVAESVAELTDPEINGEFTVDRAREILSV